MPSMTRISRRPGRSLAYDLIVFSVIIWISERKDSVMTEYRLYLGGVKREMLYIWGSTMEVVDTNKIY